MQTIAYLYDRSGAPVMESHFYAPGKFYRRHATCNLERRVTDEECVTLHVGHGVHHVYVVAAHDDKTVLMERADFALEADILRRHEEHIAAIWAEIPVEA